MLPALCLAIKWTFSAHPLLLSSQIYNNGLLFCRFFQIKISDACFDEKISDILRIPLKCSAYNINKKCRSRKNLQSILSSLGKSVMTKHVPVQLACRMGSWETSHLDLERQCKNVSKQCESTAKLCVLFMAPLLSFGLHPQHTDKGVSGFLILEPQICDVGRKH